MWYVISACRYLSLHASNTNLRSCFLCADDVLGYIGPSLQDYKGCDVIDIHPGACLWSQKLHDYLQPRRHLLMEPEDKYKPFIDPLLATPGSTYRHTTKSGAHPKSYFQSYEEIFDDALLPSREPLPRGDARLRQPNKTLLVTGTLSRRYRSVRGHLNNVHSANMLLNHMVHGSQTNTLFHAYGLVRMLFWHPEDTKSAVMPDMIVQRGGFGAALETAADMVEIAGCDRAKAQADRNSSINKLSRYRSPEIDQLGCDRTLRRMESTGVHMPAHRRPLLHQSAITRRDTTELAEAMAEERRRVPITMPEGKNLEDAVTAHEEKLAELYKLVAAGKRTLLNVPYLFKFPEASKRNFTPVDQSRLGPYMDLWGAQIALEAAVAIQESKGAHDEASTLAARLREATAKLRAAFLLKNMAAAQTRDMMRILIHEIHAFSGGVVAHDRRPFESLAVEADEFWPQFGQFLLDIQPRPGNLADDLVSPSEANATLRELVGTMWQLAASPMTMALDRIGSNASTDLIPAAPDVTNASKGGRLDPEDLCVRLATRDTIQQLTTAYLEWPFKPSSVELSSIT